MQHVYLYDSYCECLHESFACREGETASEVELPLRKWSIEVYMLNEHGEEIPASMFDKVTYTLHPSFGSRAIQSMYDAALHLYMRIQYTHV